jgi:hypothetical protein
MTDSNDRFLERDADVLRALSFGSARRPGRPSLAEQTEALARATLAWPAEPSPLLRLAAVAHGLDDGLDERLAMAPRQLAALATRDPWTVEPDEAATLRLAALVRLEQLDYRSFIPSYELALPLRDALTDPEDRQVIAAMVRWESLVGMGVKTPDRTLLIWRTHVASLYERGWEGWSPPEYESTLSWRGHLQRLAAALSWTGQAQWRTHIEPIDDDFRACTEHQDMPLALTIDAQPGGWWYYRLPTGAAAEPEWPTWPISPKRYVTRGHGEGLGTISDVWRLGERPDGVRAMTDQELSRWAETCSAQAEGFAQLGRGRTGWTVQHERAEHEQQRRRALRDAGLAE